ncbi:DUF2268 domain-containing protein [Candidatus Saccharibacteria bacterium]|nr:DUF2268 domain-containing protein [Candidatus Saccharibacteria bacterium]
MGKLRLYIANASGDLKRFSRRIKRAVRIAEKYAVPKLKIKRPIDIIFTSALGDTIPETHIGGRAHTSSFIVMTLDPTMKKKIKTRDIFQMLCHELCHSARWQRNNEWTSSLLDEMIMEGLATAFQERAAKDKRYKPDVFVQTITKRSDNINQKILKTLSKDLQGKKFDHYKIFIKGDKKLGLPRWSGYSAGYFVVRQYMLKTNTTIDQIFTEKYALLGKITPVI